MVDQVLLNDSDCGLHRQGVHAFLEPLLEAVQIGRRLYEKIWVMTLSKQ